MLLEDTADLIPTPLGNFLRVEYPKKLRQSAFLVDKKRNRLVDDDLEQAIVREMEGVARVHPRFQLPRYYDPAFSLEIPSGFLSQYFGNRGILGNVAQSYVLAKGRNDKREIRDKLVVSLWYQVLRHITHHALRVDHDNEISASLKGGYLKIHYNGGDSQDSFEIVGVQPHTQNIYPIQTLHLRQNGERSSGMGQW